jgi:hypothetical protein
VDPGGLAPPSSGANADMLLYTIRARVHGNIIQQKRPLRKGVPSVAPDIWLRNCMSHVSVYVLYFPLTYLSRADFYDTLRLLRWGG